MSDATDWTLAQQACLDLGRLLFGTLFALRVEGAERIPRHGGALIVCNHPTVLDPLLLTLALPRAASHLVKRLPAGFASITAFYDVFDCIQMGSGREALLAVKECRRVLDRGRLLVIFPEGGVSDRGRVRAFQTGAARLALASGCPVVPAAVCGSYAAMPAGATLPRPAPVTVRYGPLLRFARGHGVGAVTAVGRVMRAAVQRLYEQGEPRRAR
jgi:1-acyl-sn-glycerol-3-phosphate acyltransferase